MGGKLKALKKVAAFGCVAMLVMTAVLTDFGKAVSGMVEVQAEENRYTSGFWTYVKHDDGTVGISAYAGLEEDVSIPEMIDDMTVTAIETKAFYNNKNVGVIHIPQTISTIGYLAFAGSSITSIEVPETVTTWGETGYYGELPSGKEYSDSYMNGAFAECKELENVVIKSETIPNYAFINCTKLKTVKLGEKTKYIKERAFQNDEIIEKFEVNSNLLEVGYESFWECKNLSSITLGEKLQSVGYFAFAGSGLQSIEIPETVTTWGETGYYATIPSGKEYSDSYMNGAFAECKELENVVIESETIPNYIFFNCTKLKNVKLGKKTKYIKERAFSNDEAIERVEVKSELLEVGYESFWKCKNMKSFILGNKLQTIGYFAFAGSGLESVTIPESILTWGETGYYGELPSGKEYSDSYMSGAFAECPNLTEVNIGYQTIPKYLLLNSEKVNIHCMENTDAYNYAVNNGNSYTVYDSIPAESIKFANNQYTMLVGTAMQLYPIFAPENSTDRLSWTIGNTDIVTINDQNIVTAKANGLVSVKCTTDSGKTCTFTINVVASGDITAETETVKDITLSTVRNLQNVDYTGESTTQNLKVMFNPCTELVPGLDYDVTYKDNTEMGTATVTITGKGNYKGSFTETYEIREGVSYGDVTRDGNVDIADALLISRYDAGLVESLGRQQ